MHIPEPLRDTATLRVWLTERIAQYLMRRPDDIDPAVPLVEYDMDSVTALCLCGDVEDDLDLIVRPTLVWDHPTVDALTAHLEASVHGVRQSVRGPGGAPPSSLPL